MTRWSGAGHGSGLVEVGAFPAGRVTLKPFFCIAAYVGCTYTDIVRELGDFKADHDVGGLEGEALAEAGKLVRVL